MLNKKALKGAEDRADAMEGQMRKWGVRADGYGLCSTCTNLRIIKREYGHSIPECREIYIEGAYFRVSRENPTTECSCYWKKSWETFDELKDKALLVEPFRVKPGFRK